MPDSAFESGHYSLHASTEIGGMLITARDGLNELVNLSDWIQRKVGKVHE